MLGVQEFECFSVELGLISRGGMISRADFELSWRYLLGGSLSLCQEIVLLAIQRRRPDSVLTQTLREVPILKNVAGGMPKGQKKHKTVERLQISTASDASQLGRRRLLFDQTFEQVHPW